MDSTFTPVLKSVLSEEFGDKAETVYSASPILQYINIKTRSAQRGSKARGSFANLYAIYVVLEDYIAKGFSDKDYANDDFNAYIDWAVGAEEEAKAAILAAHQEAVEEIIGEDEPVDYSYRNIPEEADEGIKETRHRNALRAEQRLRANPNSQESK